MPARRAHVAVRSRWMPGSAIELRCYRQHSPLLTIRAGRPALLVTLTVPERI